MGGPNPGKAGSDTAAVTRQVAATWWDFFFFQKKCLLPGGIFFFYPILKVEVGYFSDKKSFSQIFENLIFFLHLNYISIKRKKKSENIF